MSNVSEFLKFCSAVQAHMEQGLPLAPGLEICYVVKDAGKWEVDPGENASEFDKAYYGGLLEMAWEEAAFVFAWITRQAFGWGRLIVTLIIYVLSNYLVSNCP